MKRILFVHHAGTIGGAPWSLLYMIKALDDTKYTSHVLFLEPGKVAQLFEKENISYSVLQDKDHFKGYKRFVHIEPDHAKWYQVVKIAKMFIWWYKVSNWLALKELRLLEFDIVHLNSLTLIDWAKAAKIDGKKVILHVREPLAIGLIGARRFFIRKQIDKYCDHIIAISNDNARRVNQPKKCVVVYNFSDFSEFHLAVNPILPRENGCFYLLYMGGAKKFKGFELLAKSVKYVNKDIRIILAGNYERFKKTGLKIRIKRILNKFVRGVPDFDQLLSDKRVHFVGLSTEIPGLIQSCDAVVFPATITHFPRPLIEGLTMKKMPLAFGIDGIEEVIKNKKNGLIIREMTSRGLAKGINELASMTKDQHKKMSDFGYQFARSNFSMANIEQITGIYDQL